jgi:hypothetical protein
VSEETAFAKKLRERREQQARQAADKATRARVAQVEVTTWADGLIPDVDGVGGEKKRDATDDALDRLLNDIDVIEGYHKFCGKMRVDKRRRTTDGIKVSCPIPGHVDANPSAWVNTDKNVWYCGRCGQGGDVYDLAAFHFGMPVPGYKEGGSFHELRKKMALSYGYTFQEAPGLDKPILVPPAQAQEPRERSVPKSSAGDRVALASADSIASGVTDMNAARKLLGEDKILRGQVVDELPADDATVTHIFGDEEPEKPATLDWHKLAKEETFLAKYMDICTVDDAPEEYHFWNAILALGLAVGRDVVLDDQKRVLANLFVCLLGGTGDRKSRSHAHLDELIYQAMPFKTDDPAGKGVDILDSMASAEALISGFINPIFDPTDPKKVASFSPVKGLIRFNELSALVGRAARKGNVLKPTLMEIYDGSRVLQTASMTHGRKRAENPFGSMFTTTQPGALKTLLREDDAVSGFLNRIVFATGVPKKPVPIGGAQIDVMPAVDPLKRVQGWAGFGRIVLWSDPAVRTFTEFFHDVLHPVQQADESGLLNRLDLLAKKLILLLCINEHRAEVNQDVVEMVIGMYPYLTAAYGIPAAHIGSTINSEVRDELLRHINAHTKAGGITLRRLMINVKRKNFPLDIVAKTIKHLCDLGFIEAQATSGVGRPTVKYKVTAD